LSYLTTYRKTKIYRISNVGCWIPLLLEVGLHSFNFRCAKLEDLVYIDFKLIKSHQTLYSWDNLQDTLWILCRIHKENGGGASRHGKKLIFPYDCKTDCSRLFVVEKTRTLSRSWMWSSKKWCSEAWSNHIRRKIASNDQQLYRPRKSGWILMILAGLGLTYAIISVNYGHRLSPRVTSWVTII
jgi:hypothetical protein